MTAYPYGDTHEPGLCNDDETWLVYNQSLLNGWPPAASHPQIEGFDELLEEAAAQGAAATAAAEHVAALYQAEPSGSNLECTNETTVFDLTGNVEEWTRREDGGEPDFHGNLKGRYWAETRTCAQNITVHGDQFRFYEIGFRCCTSPP
jgi:formylglycine-generating enzyme required for sulfatase activity